VGTINLEQAREALSKRLGPDSLKHSESVADTAASLAEAYGVDIESARLAGLLHDWSREDDDSTILNDAERAGLHLDPVERSVPYLLHARTGAMSVREAFPDLDDDVVRAVSLHTLGDVQMTDLDMVVYIADMIEPGREYRGVSKLRSAVGEVSLQELFTMAYAQSILHIIRRRKRLHPAAVEVWNAQVVKAAASRSGDQ
jgi:predicted HD superfamily hydrolase involved in NAD metabolism